MVDFFVGVFIGAVIMDFAWAYRMGMVHRLVRYIRYRFSK